MWPSCLECQASPDIDEPVPVLAFTSSPLSELGTSFDERLSLHLSALRSAILEEHERRVFQLRRSCKHEMSDELRGQEQAAKPEASNPVVEAIAMHPDASEDQSPDYVSNGETSLPMYTERSIASYHAARSTGSTASTASREHSARGPSTGGQSTREQSSRKDVGVKVDHLPDSERYGSESTDEVKPVVVPGRGRNTTRVTMHKSVSVRITDKKVDVFGQQIEEVYEDIVATLNSRAIQLKDSAFGRMMRGAGRRWQMLFNSEVIFGSFMDFIVISNIVVLGFQAGSTWGGWLAFDCFYAIMFTAEVLLKFMMQGCYYLNPKRNPDFKWHIFDICLACLSIFDCVVSYIGSTNKEHDSGYTWIRIARLVRIARILRLIKIAAFKDLLLMINGAVGGLRTLAWSIVLITIPLYVFAIFYTEMVGLQATGEIGDTAELFDSIGKSMFTGFRCLVAGDCSTMDGSPIFPRLVIQYGWVYGLVYSLTSVCMTFGLFNVIIAIYVDNTVAAAKSNELVQRQRRLEDQRRFAEKILHLAHFLWRQLHRDAANMAFDLTEALEMEISEDLFGRLVSRPEMHNLLEDLDVPKEDYKDLFEICDTHGTGIVSMAELMSGVRRLRGDPRRSDLVYVMLRINQLIREVQEIKANGELDEEGTQDWRQSKFSTVSGRASATL